MSKLFRKMALVLSVMLVIAFASPVCLYAASLDDIQSGQNDSTQDNSVYQDNQGGDTDSITNYLKDYNPVTDDNMKSAGVLAGPIANGLGTITGFIIIVVSAGIFVITALDLAYIGIPPLRGILNPNMGGGASGGMAMGGGMGMGGMQGGQQPVKKSWVSDEAIAAVQGSQPQGGGGMPMGGGMGGMGGMSGMGGQQQQQSSSSPIMTYLKKRSFFLIIFAVASILLLSSIFTDCGINLAALLNKVLIKVNNAIGGVNI